MCNATKPLNNEDANNKDIDKKDLYLSKLKKHLLLFSGIIFCIVSIISLIIFICSLPAVGFWKDWNVIELFGPENWIGWWINAISISISSFLTFSIFNYNRNQKILEDIERKKLKLLQDEEKKKLEEIRTQEEKKLEEIRKQEKNRLDELRLQEQKREKKAALIAWATYLQVNSIVVVPIHITDLKSQTIFSKLKLESTKKRVIKVTMASNTIMPIGYFFDIESVKIQTLKCLMDTVYPETFEYNSSNVCAFSNLCNEEDPEKIDLLFETFVLGNETLLNLYFVYSKDDECLTQIECYDKFHRHITDIKWEISGSIFEQNNESIKNRLCILLDSEVKIEKGSKKLEVIKVNYSLINNDQKELVDEE